MSASAPPPVLVKLLSTLFIVWLILWIVSLPLIPRQSHTAGYFACGVAPLLGWFLIKPSRIRWFIRMLFGLDGLDRR